MNPSQTWRRRSRLLDLSQRATLAISLVLTIGLFAVWAAEESVAEHSMLLLAIPVALCAVGFGMRGGLLVAAFGIALTLVWYLDGGMGLGPVAYAWQASSLVVVGVFVGQFADERRRLERQVARHEELSIDLICTADFDGYFTRVNPAWTRVLGYEHDDLVRRPFIDFVHPDDRAATIAEAERQTKAGEEVMRFENRYRHRDGSYRWLEWTSRPDPEQRELIAVARDVTERKQAEETVRRYHELLEAEVAERTAELDEARLEVLKRLALAAEYRDDETFEHTERVASTATSLCRLLGWTVRDIALMQQAAPLHDIGKLGISDTILLKPGRLTPQELALMKTHTTLGAQILSGSRSAVLRLAEEIALSHHEWWDGSGYPAGLRGDEIPLSGRIVALADVFDALTHRRPYKEPWPLEQAVQEVRRLRGVQFDHDVVDAFSELDPAALASGESKRGGLAAA